MCPCFRIVGDVKGDMSRPSMIPPVSVQHRQTDTVMSLLPVSRDAVRTPVVTNWSIGITSRVPLRPEVPADAIAARTAGAGQT